MHSKSIKAILQELKTSEKGLTSKEADKRIEVYGKNEIVEKKKDSKFKIFLRQFKSFIIYILIAAVIISIIVPFFEKSLSEMNITDFIDAIVIFIILILNSFLGFIQEYNAERAIEALKKLASLKAKVFRDGKLKQIDASELVPGDIIHFEVGDKIPADARLFEISNLETQEAILTGESMPVKKELNILPEKTILAERINMVFSGTAVTHGRAKAIVVKTAMETEIGRIATMIQEQDEPPTPLQIELQKLGKTLGFITIIICIAVVLGGFLRGGSIIAWLLTGVSLAVAAIPEGLPAVVTISLALGVKRMAKKNALIRKLPSVETLGSVTVICTDKTGTLTKNEMTVTKIYANKKIIDVTGVGYEAKGEFYFNKKRVDPEEFEMILKIGALCNNSSIDGKTIIGDPTEACLIVAASKAGISRIDEEKIYKRVNELDFTSERKRMSILTKYDDNKHFVFSKGAPDILIKFCRRILINGKIRRITAADVKDILEKTNSFAKQGLRVLGFAYKESKKLEENDLIFTGLQAMMDPIREEVKDAIEKCKHAGIRVVIVTGDHEVTAKAIAAQLNIKGKVMTGKELEEIEDLDEIVNDIGVFARVNPEHKMKIIKALKANKHIVAMTGDGVNDAPALKFADIGIAVGSGTDIAKEASNMILTDDNFASIVNAIEEGRGIYDNIRKFVTYLLSCNIAEVLIIFIAMLIAFKFDGLIALPLAVIQILWINLVTDGLPAIAIGVDPPAKNIMNRKPRKFGERILCKHSATIISVMGVIITALVLGFFYLNISKGLVHAQTLAFTLMVVLELVMVVIIRYQYDSKAFSNKFIWLAMISSFALQLLVLYSPLDKYFGTTVDTYGWFWIGLLSLFLLLAGLLVTKMTRKLKDDVCE